MTSCCYPSRSIQGTNKFFSRQARRYVKRFRKRGLAKEQCLLAEGISQTSLDGKAILEIGCGVGGLHLTLLKQGASSAVGIDISEGMIEGAKQLSADLCFEKQASYFLGDFVEMNGEIKEADITILDKVVCCYENLDHLLKQSLSKTRRIYALSFPRPNIFVKLMFHLPIGIGKLLNWSFHPYWHDWNEMLGTIEKSGFKQTFQKHTFFWAVKVFERG